jgi:hypothetical protein
MTAGTCCKEKSIFYSIFTRIVLTETIITNSFWSILMHNKPYITLCSNGTLHILLKTGASIEWIHDAKYRSYKDVPPREIFPHMTHFREIQ